jgi:hypothetical protein
MFLGTSSVTMYLRKCETRRPSAAEKYVTGVLDCDDAEEVDGMLNDICWRVSGRFDWLIGGTGGDVSDVVGDRSSNRSKTITFGSDLVLLPEPDPVLVCCPLLV